MYYVLNYVLICFVLNYVPCTKLCAEVCALYLDCIPVAEPFPNAEDSNKACLSLGDREGKLVDYGGFTRFFLYEGASDNVRIKTLTKISEEFRESFQDYRVFLVLISRPGVLIVKRNYSLVRISLQRNIMMLI